MKREITRKKLMPPFRVLVFPSCNEPGLEVIQALKKSNKVQVFAASSIDPTFDPSAALVTHYFTVPFTTAPSFQRVFLRLLQRYHIDLIFPTEDSVVTLLASWKNLPARSIGPKSKTALLVRSKSTLYRHLSGVVPVPMIYKGGHVPFPAFAKPDIGSGSRGAIKLVHSNDLVWARKKGLLVTEYLPGKEYTVDAVNDRGGHLLFANVRIRGKLGAGIALGTKSVRNSAIVRYMKLIVETIQIEGPWFAQFKENAKGEPVVTEVNCRIGGSSGLTRYGGVNIPLLSVFLYAGHSIRVPLYYPVTVNRRLLPAISPIEASAIFWDLDDTLLTKNGHVDTDAVALLYDFFNRNVTQFLISRKAHLRKLLRVHQLPGSLFREIVTSTDRPGAILSLCKKYRLKPQRCIAINDSMMENLMIQKEIPKLRVITPDALAIAGTAKTS